LTGIFKLAADFKRLETENDFFALKTHDGIRYWDIVRSEVYNRVLSRKGFLHTSYLLRTEQVLAKRVTKAAYLLFRSIVNDLKLVFSKRRHFDYAFLFLSRFEDGAGNPQDLVLKDIYDMVGDNSFCIEFFRHRAFGFFKRNTRGRYFIYKLELMNLIGTKRKEHWNGLGDIINEEFGIEDSWDIFFDDKIAVYRNEYRFFYDIFKRIRPKYFFFQTDPKSMIAAANDLGVTTIDVLHGYVNGLGTFYSYSELAPLKGLNTFPKILLTFSEYASSLINFPAEKIVSGSNYFYVERDELARSRKGMMMVSGRFIHDHLLEVTGRLAVAHPDIIFYYKLHSNQAQDVEATRLFFSLQPNVKVIYTEKSVTAIMEDCFAIGLVQSTVAYQALQKGLQVYIFKKDYFEISYDIFDDFSVFMVDSWGECSDLLKQRHAKIRSESKTIFFEPFNKSVVGNIICGDQ